MTYTPKHYFTAQSDRPVKTPKYIVITMDGQTLDNHGVGYVSRSAARKAADRRGLCPVETRPIDEEMPHINDAQGWNDYRTRHGYAGGR